MAYAATARAEDQYPQPEAATATPPGATTRPEHSERHASAARGGNRGCGRLARADFAKDTATVGPRGHFKIGKSMWLRPGISYSQGLDKPLTDGKYHVLQINLPVIF